MSNAIRTVAAARVRSFSIPWAVRARHPVDACQYGDQRTATRYVPGRETRITTRDWRSATTVGRPGPVTIGCGCGTAYTETCRALKTCVSPVLPLRTSDAS